MATEEEKQEAFDEDFLGVFPIFAKVGNTAISKGGISIRDWFAGQALIGILSGLCSRGEAVHWATMAAQAYEAANAMLEARKR